MSDPTAIDLRLDPLHQRMTGRTHHGNLEIDVPYVSRVNQDLWMGGCMDGLRLPHEITHVFSLYPWERYVLASHQTRTEVRMYDSLDQDLSEVWAIADQVIEAQKTGQVLVHCQAGLNRSGLVTAAVLIKEGALPSVAIRRLRALRSPAVLCNPTFEAWLLRQAPGGRPSCCEGTPVSHDGSRGCKSGSIASGGTRAHCTCDACF